MTDIALELLKVQFEEHKRLQAQRLTQIQTSLRNVIVDLEEGDYDEAIETLRELIGD